VKLLAIPTWRDPLRGLLHDYYTVHGPAEFQRIRYYTTGCGLVLSVDDVNKSNLVSAEPTCLACIVNVVLRRKE
jgi:hypothetical protein